MQINRIENMLPEHDNENVCSVLPARVFVNVDEHVFLAVGFAVVKERSLLFPDTH